MTLPSSASAAEPDTALPAGRLLVIDGALVQQVIVQRTAAALGLAADAAGTPGEASRLLCEQPYDVVLLDLWLDQADGRELLQVVAAACGRPRVVLVGGPGAVRDAAAALAASLDLPVTAALTKPFDIPALREVLCRALSEPEAPEARPGSEVADAGAFAAALAAGEVTFTFQPQVALGTRRPVGAEALARWTSPRFGTVPPQRFLPLAIRSGTTALLTDVALRAALTACAEWRCRVPTMTVAVNLPAVALRDPGLPALVGQRLREAGLEPDALVVEVATAEVEDAAAGMASLRRLGIGLAVEGFEAGEMALRALQRLPADFIKIGPTLARAAAERAAAAALLRALTAAAHALGRQVAAVAIETTMAEATVLAAGCDRAQGWLYGPAMSAEATLQWLDQAES